MKIIYSTILTMALVFVILLAACDINSPSYSSVVRHVPEITQFVFGMTLADTDYRFGSIWGKTVFYAGDLLLYGFRAKDSAGDWGKMVHIVKFTDQTPDFSWDLTNYFPDDQTADLSWDFSNDFLNLEQIAVDMSYRLEKSGTYKMTWYIVDKAGNVSNAKILTLTVN